MADQVTLSTCLGCGCTCDDIDVHVRDGRITAATNACALGAAWFGDGRVPARVRLDGHDAAPDAALDAAAALLTASRNPLIYLAPDLSCEAQREAIALADALNAAIDSVTTATALPSIVAAQERGRAGATLGEIRNRADVLVFWGVDPAVRYPRYRSRYSPDPAGVHLPDGRRSRKVVAVDIGASRGPDDADARVAIEPADEVAVLTALGVAARGVTLPEPGGAGPSAAGGAPWSIARTLAPHLMQGRYVVIVADAEADETTERDGGRASALIALAQTLNGTTRCALSTLRGGGNRSGADATLTSQTGYPCAVNFSHGFPRYRPFDGSAGVRLTRGEVDAALVLGSASGVPDAIAKALSGVHCAVAGPAASESALAKAAVVIDTGVAGIHEGGTAIRMDDLPLPLRPSLGGLASMLETIRAVRERVVATTAERAR